MTALILLSDWQKSQIEFWRRIEGFEGYDVSSFGRVRSRWQRAGWRRGYEIRNDKAPLIFNGYGHKQGYRVATLSASGKRRTFMIHRLVAQAFIPNDMRAPEVNHLTGIKHDNRMGNLEWATRKENQNHAWRVGLITPNHVRAGQQWLSKVFSPDDIMMIRRRRAAGESCGDLSQAYGVTNGCISEIVTGVTFAEMGGPRSFRPQFYRLTDQEVREVRSLVKAKAATQTEIGRRFNIDPSDVSRIASRKRYRHVSD